MYLALNAIHDTLSVPTEFLESEFYANITFNLTVRARTYVCVCACMLGVYSMHVE